MGAVHLTLFYVLLRIFFKVGQILPMCSLLQEFLRNIFIEFNYLNKESVGTWSKQAQQENQHPNTGPGKSRVIQDSGQQDLRTFFSNTATLEHNILHKV